MSRQVKSAVSLFLIVFVLLIFVGAALAAEMSGEVTAVDAAKGTLTLKTGTLEAGFDCEAGSLIKDVKVGDQVTVQYKEEGGKKTVTKVTPMKAKTHVGC
jgi:Cu/Ag efflux protein CusF